MEKRIINAGNVYTEHLPGIVKDICQEWVEYFETAFKPYKSIAIYYKINHTDGFYMNMIFEIYSIHYRKHVDRKRNPLFTIGVSFSFFNSEILKGVSMYMNLWDGPMSKFPEKPYAETILAESYGALRIHGIKNAIGWLVPNMNSLRWKVITSEMIYKNEKKTVEASKHSPKSLHYFEKLCIMYQDKTETIYMHSLTSFTIETLMKGEKYPTYEEIDGAGAYAKIQSKIAKAYKQIPEADKDVGVKIVKYNSRVVKNK